MILSAPPFEAYPLVASNLNEATVLKLNRLIGTIIKHESFFTDFTKACPDACGLCHACQRAKAIVVANLSDAKSLTWEVWEKDEITGELLDFTGILRLSRINLGCDATAHYFFFDGKLRDKTALLQAWAKWTFSDHPGWKGLQRVTIEIPAHAFALARHASKHLGFGGPYVYKRDDTLIHVEGVKGKALRWRNSWHDLLIMGKLNDANE